MSLVGNERVKLTANWLNTLASATATVGVLAPAASIAYGVGPSPPSATLFLVALPIWFYCALCLLWREIPAPRAEAVTSAQFFVLFVLPILIAAFGWAVALWAVREARKESRPPAE